MIIEALTLGALATNCYLVYDPESLEGVIIDPADEAEFLAEKAARLKLSIKAIIATHGHFDHNLGAGELQLITNAPYFIHKKDLFLLKRLNDSATYWLGYKHNKPLPQDIQFLTNEMFYASSFKLQVIPTPGHTPGSLCIYLKGSKLSNILFSGDTLFKGAIGRYDFSYSNKAKLDQSLKKLFKLPGDTIVYPGHGESTKISDEKKF